VISANSVNAFNTRYIGSGQFSYFGTVWPLLVTGQLTDKPTRGQSSCGLVNSQNSQLAEMFDLKFGVYNSS